jgi:hypothetical protein
MNWRDNAKNLRLPIRGVRHTRPLTKFQRGEPNHRPLSPTQLSTILGLFLPFAPAGRTQTNRGKDGERVRKILPIQYSGK